MRSISFRRLARLALMTVALAAVFGPVVHAGDFNERTVSRAANHPLYRDGGIRSYDRSGPPVRAGRGENSRHLRTGERHRTPRSKRIVVTSDHLPLLAPDSSYYGGGLDAWYDPGNGLYLHRYRNEARFYDPDTVRPTQRGTPRIIHVRPGRAQQACAWESGICVIRR